MGVAAGDFHVDDLRATTVAIISMCVDIARWYSPEGRLPPGRLADVYENLILRMLRADGSTNATIELHETHRPIARRIRRQSPGT